MTTIEKVKELVSNGGSYVNLTNGTTICKGWIPYVRTKTRFEVLNVKTENGSGGVVFNAKGKMIKNNIHSNNDNWSLVLEEEKKSLSDFQTDYKTAYDKNGIQHKVKRGKEFIEFMIANN
jgi:hypothetical protein